MQKEAEAYLPHLVASEGLLLTMADFDTHQNWTFRYRYIKTPLVKLVTVFEVQAPWIVGVQFKWASIISLLLFCSINNWLVVGLWLTCALVLNRFWSNNKSRMYLLENTRKSFHHCAIFQVYFKFDSLHLRVLEVWYNSIYFIFKHLLQGGNWQFPTYLPPFTAGDFVRAHNLQERDMIFIYKDAEGSYVRGTETWLFKYFQFVFMLLTLVFLFSYHTHSFCSFGLGLSLIYIINWTRIVRN